MGELTTRRDYKPGGLVIGWRGISARFCRSISLATRLDLFLRLVVAHCEMGNPYVPPAVVEKLEPKQKSPPVELVRAPTRHIELLYICI